MSTLGKLRDVNDALRGEDEPVVVQIVGMLLAVGLFIRSTTHIYVTLFAVEIGGTHISPELGGSDVTFASPVAALRGTRLDVTARAATLGVGLALWAYMTPLTGGSAAVQAFVVAQLAVCICDPLWLGLWRLRSP